VAATHMEPHTAAGLEGAIGRVEAAILSTQPSTERRARATTLTTPVEAQNGTYACARVPQALSALGSTRHSVNR